MSGLVARHCRWRTQGGHETPPWPVAGHDRGSRCARLSLLMMTVALGSDNDGHGRALGSPHVAVARSGAGTAHCNVKSVSFTLTSPKPSRCWLVAVAVSLLEMVKRNALRLVS